MKEYPTISGKRQDNITVYCFPKYDGSNIRVEWTSKKGFRKFGSRTCLIDELSHDLGKLSIPLLRKEEKSITQILKKTGVREATLFWEFFGSESSFAGNHNFAATDHEVRLIDISVFQRGFLNPVDFIKLFENYERVAPCIYHGKANEEFTRLVKTGKLEGQTFEGIVAKANRSQPNCHEPVQFKIKSEAWIKQLHTRYADRPDIIKEQM